MSFLRQFLIGAIVLAATLALWIFYVPSAGAWLDRTGIPALFGIELAAPEAGPEGGPRFGGGGPARVVVDAAQEGVVNDRVAAVGDGRALRSVTVRSEATGRIAAIERDAGSYVEAGSVLVRLDDEAERIALDRAQLLLADARDQVERLSQLEGSGAVTAVRFREADLALRTAELAVREAEFDLGRRVIRAPIPGWIGIIEVETGDRITVQDTLAVVTDRSELIIDFRVPERVVGQIEPGMIVSVAPLSGASVPIEGRITAIDNVVDRASRTLRVQATIPNPSDRLRAGMAFAVEVALPGERLPAVDPLAIQWTSTGSFVWVVRDGTVARVPVIIRERSADRVLVEADLAVGEPVVTEGVQTLRPGAEVEIVVPGGADGARAAAAITERG
jgi:RND family efflux transporter MFP subunit